MATIVTRRRLFLVVTSALIALLISDFIIYLRAAGAEDTYQNDMDDCVVVLTGRHGRVVKAIGRYEKKRHLRKLLLSGAKEGTNKFERQQLKNTYPELFDCCIEFGWMAEDTVGNGIEANVWAKKSNCTSLTLLTDDYHMPRASLVFEHYVELDDIRFERIEFSANWSALTVSGWREIGAEYGKFVWMRIMLAWHDVREASLA